MNHMKDVAQLLGIEIGEEFKIKGCGYSYSYKYKLTEEHLEFFSNSKWYAASATLVWLLNGQAEVIKLPKHILTDKEKEDLSGVIRPWRDRVQYIKKTDCDTWDGIREYITIKYKEHYDTSRPCFIDLPTFETGTMYKGMELGEQYTLDDLKL